ncbi:hypothetical protein V6N11_051943 [Hibiscus sabdariffa]|uniref:Uncharacterized protein n=1 Tax=Hibiscus sabdariffa TaxID=183260 RepID=A0ABR2U8Z7_9ROSI
MCRFVINGSLRCRRDSSSVDHQQSVVVLLDGLLIAGEIQLLLNPLIERVLKDFEAWPYGGLARVLVGIKVNELNILMLYVAYPMRLWSSTRSMNGFPRNFWTPSDVMEDLGAVTSLTTLSLVSPKVLSLIGATIEIKVKMITCHSISDDIPSREVCSPSPSKSERVVAIVRIICPCDIFIETKRKISHVGTSKEIVRRSCIKEGPVSVAVEATPPELVVIAKRVTFVSPPYKELRENFG